MTQQKTLYDQWRQRSPYMDSPDAREGRFLLGMGEFSVNSEIEFEEFLKKLQMQKEFEIKIGKR